jgi:hypothetical protein
MHWCIEALAAAGPQETLTVAAMITLCSAAVIVQ